MFFLFFKSQFFLSPCSPDASAADNDDDLFALERELEKAGELMQDIVSIRDDLANLGFKIDLGKEL